MKKFFIGLIGGTLLVLGVALLVLPGPGLLVMAAGLAVLASEFIWARRALRRCKRVGRQVARGPVFSRLLTLVRRRTRRSPARIAS